MRSRSSASDPLAAALRLLSTRDRSEGELAGHLRRKGYGEEEIAAVLGRCRELGYLDDARFARERARRMMAAGKGVGPKVLADLAAHGVSAGEARAACEEAAAENPPEDVLRNLLQRRYPGLDFAAADDRERRRVVNYLLRRGFSLPLVLSILKEER